MKNTILLFAVLFISGALSAGNRMTGNTSTSYGNYTLLKQEQLVVSNNVAYRAWTLNYEGLGKSFTVLYSPGVDGQCSFIVKNDQFEIQYAVVDGNFGAKLVDPSNRTIKKKEILKQVNNEQLMMQSRLTSNPKSVEEYLGLVACYLPHLLV